MRNKHLQDEMEYYSEKPLKEVDLNAKQEEYDLFDSSDDAGNEVDYDVNEVVDHMESIDDGINVNNFNFMEV